MGLSEKLKEIQRAAGIHTDDEGRPRLTAAQSDEVVRLMMRPCRDMAAERMRTDDPERYERLKNGDWDERLKNGGEKLGTALRYQGQLVELHGEMRSGCGEGERARELRAEMAETWPKLTDEQRALFDHLSEALYALDGIKGSAS